MNTFYIHFTCQEYVHLNSSEGTVLWHGQNSNRAVLRSKNSGDWASHDGGVTVEEIPVRRGLWDLVLRMESVKEKILSYIFLSFNFIAWEYMRELGMLKN